MKIPKTLKIGGHKIKVDCSKVHPDADGMWIIAEDKIMISKDLPQTHKEATLIHEIFHVMNSTIGVSKVGHSLLDSLSEQFYQVLHDNKMLR